MKTFQPSAIGNLRTPEASLPLHLTNTQCDMFQCIELGGPINDGLVTQADWKYCDMNTVNKVCVVWRHTHIHMQKPESYPSPAGATHTTGIWRYLPL